MTTFINLFLRVIGNQWLGTILDATGRKWKTVIGTALLLISAGLWATGYLTDEQFAWAGTSSVTLAGIGVAHKANVAAQAKLGAGGETK